MKAKMFLLHELFYPFLCSLFLFLKASFTFSSIKTPDSFLYHCDSLNIRPPHSFRVPSVTSLPPTYLSLALSPNSSLEMK